MTFLDLTEGDKLAFLVVELHVGPMRSGIKIRYLLCAAKFEGTPIRRSLSVIYMVCVCVCSVSLASVSIVCVRVLSLSL
jgi:hypothetical protein